MSRILGVRLEAYAVPPGPGGAQDSRVVCAHNERVRRRKAEVQRLGCSLVNVVTSRALLEGILGSDEEQSAYTRPLVGSAIAWKVNAL